MAEGRVRVLLVDDHELRRQGLRRMLELEKDMEVVGEAASVEEALEMMAALSPDIVLMPPRTQDALRQFWRVLEINPKPDAVKQWVPGLPGASPEK